MADTEKRQPPLKYSPCHLSPAVGAAANAGTRSPVPLGLSSFGLDFVRPRAGEPDFFPKTRVPSPKDALIRAGTPQLETVEEEVYPKV